MTEDLRVIHPKENDFCFILHLFCILNKDWYFCLVCECSGLQNLDRHSKIRPQGGTEPHFHITNSRMAYSLTPRIRMLQYAKMEYCFHPVICGTDVTHHHVLYAQPGCLCYILCGRNISGLPNWFVHSVSERDWEDLGMKVGVILQYSLNDHSWCI